MMNYVEFVDFVAKDIVNEEGLDNFEIHTATVEKLQGASYYGLRVRIPNSKLGFNMDIHKLYDEFAEGESYRAVLTRIVEFIIEQSKKTPDFSFDRIGDYDEIKDHLMIQVVSAETNADFLKNVPHHIKDDLAVVYRCIVGENKKGRASYVIENSHLKHFGITAEQLHADALKSSQANYPAQFMNISDMFGIFNSSPMYVARSSEINGAGCIFYPDFMDEVSEKLGGDFFILPSSIHEVIMVPDDGEDNNALTLLSIVREVNETEVSKEEKLTDAVYHYDSMTRQWGKVKF